VSSERGRVVAAKSLSRGSVFAQVSLLQLPSPKGSYAKLWEGNGKTAVAISVKSLTVTQGVAKVPPSILGRLERWIKRKESMTEVTTP